jgi:hypothetical protein
MEKSSSDTINAHPGSTETSQYILFRKLYKYLKVHQELFCSLLIVIAIILANAAYVVGIKDSNPLLTRSDLATGRVENVNSGSNTIDPNDGYTSQALGHAAAIQWIHGQVPYWNYFEGVGAPLAGEMQSAAFFPPVILLYFANGLLYMHLILEAIAGIATFLFLRKLRISRFAATIGGIGFAISGTFAWLANAVVNPIAFLPLLLLGIEMIFENSKQKKKVGSIIVAVSLALSLYSGFPEVAYLNALFITGWTLLRFFQVKTNRLQSTKFLLFGCTVGIFLATPILIPFIDYLRFGNTGLHANSLDDSSLTKIGIAPLFMPYVFGQIFGFVKYSAHAQLLSWWNNVGGYVSVSLLVLGSLSIFSKERRAIKIFLVVWSGLTLLKIFGIPPFTEIFDIIPGVNSTSYFRYAIVAVEFAAVVLASLSLDEIIKHKLTRITVLKGSVLPTVLIVISLTVMGLELRNIVGAPHELLIVMLSIFWVVIVTTLILMSALIFKDNKQKIVLAFVVIVDVGLMYMIPQLSAPISQQLDLGPVTYLQKNIGLYRFYTLGPIKPNFGSYFGISSININDLPIPKSYGEYISNNLSQNIYPLTFTGAKQSNPNGPTPAQEFFTNLAGYQNLSVKYLVSSENTVSKSVALHNQLVNVFDDGKIVIYKLPYSAPFFEVLDRSSCSIQSETISAAILECKKPATLLRREQSMPGWSARVNGRGVNITTADKIFQEITLPSGTSRVVFSFNPPNMIAAKILLFIGLLLIVGVMMEDKLNFLAKHVGKYLVRLMPKRR